MSITLDNVTIPLQNIALVQPKEDPTLQSKRSYYLYIHLKNPFYDPNFDEEKKYVLYFYKTKAKRQADIEKIQTALNLNAETEKHRNDILEKLKTEYCAK